MERTCVLDELEVTNEGDAGLPPAIGAMPVSLAVSVTHTEGAAVVTFRGDLDLATQGQLRRTLADMVRLEPALVIVDLSQVGSFDCVAIGEFVRARSILRDLGSTLVLRSPPSAGLRALQVVDLLDLVSLASLRDVRPAAAPQEDTSLATEVEVLTTAWRTACDTHPTTFLPVVFKEPELIVSEILREFDRATESGQASTFDPACPDTLSHDASAPRLAVLQLLELRRVVQAWIAWSAFSAGRQRELERRLTEVLDASVLEIVSAALAELEHAALIDPLTGLMNRRALDRDLTQFLAAARRHGRALTVVMLDVVGLKSTNDRFGHEAGDDLLQDVAAGLVGTLRVGDNVYRVGGDEFVLLLPDLRPEAVHAVMDRTVVGPGGAFTWGSAGVPTDLGDDDATPASLLRLADQRMMQHRSGRVTAAKPTASPDTVPQKRFAGKSARLVSALTAAGRSHAVLEQAKGVVAEHFGIEVAVAADVLQDFSTQRSQSVRRTAYAIVERTISPDDLAPDGPVDAQPVCDAAHPADRGADADRA